MEFSEKNIFDAIKNVPEWEVLGLRLGFSSDELNIIQRDSNGTSGAIICLIGSWLRNDEGASWKKLARSLRQMGRKKLADSLYTEDSVEISSSVTPTIEMKSPNREREKLKSPVKTDVVDELALSSLNTKRNIERNILRLEKQFGLIVKDTKEEILRDEHKIRELPDIIEYGLPHRLKGLRNFVTYTTLTKENFHLFFKALERMWTFIDYDLLRTIIYEFENVELMNKVDSYIQEVDIFCAQTTIQDFIDIWKPRYEDDKIPEDLIVCVTELSLDLKTSKVEDVKKIQHKLKDPLPQELAMAAFCFHKLEKGCVRVSWLVWANSLPDLMDRLKYLLQSDSEFITETNLLYMLLDNVILYSIYNDQMLTAILNGDIKVVKELLESRRVDPNSVHHKYKVLPHAPNLTIASLVGDLKIVQELLVHNAEVNSLTKNGISPLYAASQKGNVEVVRELVAKGAQIDLQNLEGTSPLHIASYFGRTETVRELIANGAQINLQKINGASPLHIASYFGHTETVRELIRQGAQIDLQINNGASPLIIGSYTEHTETLLELVEKGVHIDLDGASPLHVACFNGHTEIVRELLSNGALIDLRKNTGTSPLCIASQNGHTETVRELIAQGADKDLQNNDGATPLHIASCYGHTETVKELIAQGADKDLKNNDGATPLHIACLYGHSETVRELIIEGAQIDLLDSSGATPLIIASERGHTGIVKELLRKDADVNALRGGWSSLMNACYNDHLDVVKLSLSNKVDIDLANENGLSALKIALWTNNITVDYKILFSKEKSHSHHSYSTYRM